MDSQPRSASPKFTGYNVLFTVLIFAYIVTKAALIYKDYPDHIKGLVDLIGLAITGYLLWWISLWQDSPGKFAGTRGWKLFFQGNFWEHIPRAVREVLPTHRSETDAAIPLQPIPIPSLVAEIGGSVGGGQPSQESRAATLNPDSEVSGSILHRPVRTRTWENGSVQGAASGVDVRGHQPIQEDGSSTSRIRRRGSLRSGLFFNTTRPLPVAHHERDEVNILSLDGGGIRGASELLILKEKMNRIRWDYGIERPCELFDLIGGSGTGGLIAILLGRLGLTIDEAISGYAKISNQSFGSGETDPETISANLEKAMKEFMEERGFDENEMMQDTTFTKTFVVAMNGDRVEGSKPELFRSFRVQGNEGPNCKVWEAVRATTASRGLLSDVEIVSGDLESGRYVGTSLGNNNPAAWVIEEAKALFPNNPLGTIVSIGAGHPGVIDLPRGSEMVQETLEAICLDCEETNEDLERQAVGDPYLKDKYWRFSVQQGMDRINLKDVDTPSKINAHTKSYLRGTEVTNKLDMLVTALTKEIECLR